MTFDPVFADLEVLLLRAPLLLQPQATEHIVQDQDAVLVLLTALDLALHALELHLQPHRVLEGLLLRLQRFLDLLLYG
eukprot:CAMPEP_0171094588 /NCGR_PEP_ID=MMETSP0766_2-20121228/41685_1 /TAXON_ID=439317 /ORGANISM="Gambierdiscus australes, Strain CAWD 149" /LENGTH=77 /DNA_ID=CAMNT_0011553261 /DNA_START=118 /DNA_END=348 /DNA_ORIENTATION=+